MTYAEYLSHLKKCDKTTIKATALDVIEAVACKDFAALIKNVNLSQLCSSFNIPLRTAQDWKAGKRTPPPYVIELIGFALISEMEET